MRGLAFTSVMLLSFWTRDCLSSDRAEGRYSFSLSTFDPSGKLGQVDRAHEAAALGPPLIGVILPNSRQIVMAAPQILPSILMEDDGTPRFARITPEIMVGHSGLSADGRFLLQEAHRIAVEHEFTFDEHIPIELLLEELSLLYQQYTMKAAARPLGVTLLIGYQPQELLHPSDNNNHQPTFYRLDPSGNVIAIQGFVIINGNLEQTQLKESLEKLRNDGGAPVEATDDHPEHHSAQAVVEALRTALDEQARKRSKVPLSQVPRPENGVLHRPTIVSSFLCHNGRFSVRRSE